MYLQRTKILISILISRQFYLQCSANRRWKLTAICRLLLSRCLSIFDWIFAFLHFFRVFVRKFNAITRVLAIRTTQNAINHRQRSERTVALTYRGMVLDSRDSTFHDAQLAHPICPIQHSDRIRANQCPAPLYCCRLSSDLCALNQSVRKKKEKSNWKQWKRTRNREIVMSQKW